MDRDEIKYLLTFTEGTIYRYDHDDYSYVMSVHSGNYSMADCIPCTKTREPIDGYETPIPIRDIDLGEIIN